MQKNKLTMLLILSLFMINLASSDMEGFEEARNIISSKVICDDLSEKQLEILGDYYMEQMHPGEAHERMDAIMGGEGSESLRQVHINMGIRFYCGGNNYYGMMGGIMQGRNYYSNNYWNFTSILVNVLLIVLIILGVVWILTMSKAKK